MSLYLKCGAKRVPKFAKGIAGGFAKKFFEGLTGIPMGDDPNAPKIYRNQDNVEQYGDAFGGLTQKALITGLTAGAGGAVAGTDAAVKAAKMAKAGNIIKGVTQGGGGSGLMNLAKPRQNIQQPAPSEPAGEVDSPSAPVDVYNPDILANNLEQQYLERNQMAMADGSMRTGLVDTGKGTEKKDKQNTLLQKNSMVIPDTHSKEFLENYGQELGIAGLLHQRQKMETGRPVDSGYKFGSHPTGTKAKIGHKELVLSPEKAAEADVVLAQNGEMLQDYAPNATVPLKDGGKVPGFFPGNIRPRPNMPRRKEDLGLSQNLGVSQNAYYQPPDDGELSIDDIMKAGKRKNIFDLTTAGTNWLRAWLQKYQEMPGKVVPMPQLYDESIDVSALEDAMKRKHHTQRYYERSSGRPYSLINYATNLQALKDIGMQKALEEQKTKNLNVDVLNQYNKDLQDAVHQAQLLNWQGEAQHEQSRADTIGANQDAVSKALANNVDLRYAAYMAQQGLNT